MKAYILVCGSQLIALDTLKTKLNQIINSYKEVAYIGVDRGAKHLLDAGFRVDLAIGDFDSSSELEYKEIYEKATKTIKAPAKKDDTDTELAFKYLLTLPKGDYFIYGALAGGRLSHLLSNLWMVYDLSYQSIFERLYFVEDNLIAKFYYPGEYKLTYNEKYKYVSLVGFDSVKDLVILDAVYELEQTSFKEPIALISNELEVDKDAYFKFSEGLILVIWEEDDQK